MNKFHKYAVITLSIIGVFLISFLVRVTDVSAHRSPAGCTGSGLSITLFASVPEARIGDVISYSVNVFNGFGSGPIVCDASDITASVVTPDGTTHPITLLRTALSNGDSDSYPNVVTYTARTEDVKTGDLLLATASATGTIHQNDTDSQGGGDQSVNIKVVNTPVPADIPTSTPVVVPPVPSPVTPPPAGGGVSISSGGSHMPRVVPLINITKIPSPLALPGGPGLVTYSYVVSTAGGRLALTNITVNDDKCSPVTMLSGDLNGNGKLDPNETWKYSCAVKLSNTTTNTAIVTGYGDDIYRQSVTAKVITTVPVSVPVLPNAGFPPEETNVLWSIFLFISAFALIPMSLFILCKPRSR